MLPPNTWSSFLHIDSPFLPMSLHVIAKTQKSHQQGTTRSCTCSNQVSCAAARYETKLSAERDIGLRLKGENGIMKKKFNALQKDIEDQRDEIKTLFEHKKELYQVGLECTQLSACRGPNPP